MNPLNHFAIPLRRLRQRLISRILAHRVEYHNPTLRSHPTALWDYGYADLDAIELGSNVKVGPLAEIVVYKRTRYSRHEGRLMMGRDSVISTGANIRAAGGVIRIGCGSVVGQHCVLVAANHRVVQGLTYLYNPWDESKTGIDIGDNVWMGAGCIILPGVRIGDNAVVGAGSVVTAEVPPNEIWAGVPARKIKAVPVEVATTREAVPLLPGEAPAPPDGARTT